MKKLICLALALWLALGAAGTMVILLALFWAVKEIREHEGTLDGDDEEDNE